MELTDAFLIVVILVIAFMLFNGSGRFKSSMQCFTPESDAGVPTVFTGKGTTIGREKMTHEMTYDEKANKALNEQMEYFQVCKDPDEIKRVAECVCEGQDTFDYAENAYGAPGLDYKSWVTSQSVGDDVIKNHQQYIADRDQLQTGGAYFTGRTISPDSHDSYDPIPWIGLRRPQYVEQCNPTQVPDIDISLYKGNRQFCFKT